MKAAIQRMLRRLGWELRRAASPPPPPSDSFGDLSTTDREIMRTVLPYTMTSPERIAELILAVQHVCRHQVPGAIVECGVWRGGSMMAAARTLQACGDTSRELFLYDTYEGMPPPTAMDRRLDGEAAETLLAREPKGSGIWCEASLEDVRRNVHSTNYPSKLVRFVRGKVEVTIPATVPDKIALLRLDTDWFESTRHELVHLYPRLQRWGILIIDDYGHWQGARAAVDEYLGQLTHPTFLHRVDNTGRLLVKTEP